MLSGGVSPIGNPRHESGFEPAPGQQKPKLFDRLAGAVHSCNHLNDRFLGGFHGRGFIPMPKTTPYAETR